MRHLSVLTAPLCRVIDLTVETLRGWLGSLRKSLVVLSIFSLLKFLITDFPMILIALVNVCRKNCKKKPHTHHTCLYGHT